MSPIPASSSASKASSSSESSSCPVDRGLLIVFEGCDRSGKTTHCKRITKELGDEAVFMRFPDRSTPMGQMIDGYLKGEKQLNDKVIHLLFAANRWEKVQELEEAIQAGKHVIVDRYSYSGIAFSSVKDGMDLEWCRQPERGLPRPDLVCFLDVSPEEALKRGGFGDERYEKREIQERVRKVYSELFEEKYWTRINTDGKSLDEVYNEIHNIIKRAIDNNSGRSKTLNRLWPL